MGVASEPIQQIGRARRPRWRRGHPRRLGDLAHPAAKSQAAGEYRGGQRVQVRLAGQLRVERLELAGRLQQQRGRVTAAAGGERDLAAQQVRPSPPEFIRRPSLRGDQQGQGRIERASLVRGLRRGQRPLRPARRVQGQRGRALQEGGRRGQPAARLGPARRALQLRSDVLIGPRRRLRAVPGPAIGIGLRIGRVGQCLVRGPPFGRRRAPVHRRPHQRMPK